MTAAGATAIPEYTREGLRRYIDEHIPPGGFLYAVLTNDLLGAVACADAENRFALVAIVIWLQNSSPAECWGSEERVERWLGRRQR